MWYKVGACGLWLPFVVCSSVVWYLVRLSSLGKALGNGQAQEETRRVARQATCCVGYASGQRSGSLSHVLGKLKSRERTWLRVAISAGVGAGRGKEHVPVH